MAKSDGYINVNGQHVVQIDYSIRHDSLVDGCLDVLAIVFPHWNQRDVKVDQFQEGMTNKLLRCSHSNSDEVVLVRIYGKNTELLIDRNQELNNILCLNKIGFCPQLYAKFRNGFIYGYLAGHALNAKSVADCETSILIARKLGKWHRLNIERHPEPSLFCTLRSWTRLVPLKYKTDEQNSLFEKICVLGKLQDQIDLLETKFKLLNSPVVFCHNDLLPPNIIYDDTTRDVAFIDYEYASYNYRGFDIGNHFCEFAGVECDWTHYPSVDFQLRWFRQYLEIYNNTEDVSPESVHALFVEVNVFSLAAHLYWGIWALIQAYHSDLDFDYLQFAYKRISKYYLDRDLILRMIK